jgi:hypothetical protein
LEQPPVFLTSNQEKGLGLAVKHNFKNPKKPGNILFAINLKLDVRAVLQTAHTAGTDKQSGSKWRKENYYMATSR